MASRCFLSLGRTSKLPEERHRAEVAMATARPVNNGAMRCRDCGGPTSLEGNRTWCRNRAPKPSCENLTAQGRHFCEHCGCANPGPDDCPDCRLPPLRP